MKNNIFLELEKAEAEVERIRKEIITGPCLEYGHNWKHYGNRNVCCSDECDCSIPVNKCSKCGDYDYGDNEESKMIIIECNEFKNDNKQRN